MEDATSSDLKKVLQALSESSFGYKRYNAAVALGKLTISNEEVVRALAVAVALDRDADVRSAALEALQSPAHQVFLKDRPEFIREATKLAQENRATEKRKDEENIVTEFIRRRTRERIYYLTLIGSMFASCLVLIVGAIQRWLDESTVRAWQIIVIAFAIFLFYKSWRNWRCPVCDSWLGGFTATINPIWSSDTVRCPHCGAKLL